MDKPPGISSARAVSRVKRLLPKKTKIGHTGTLDPLASGLLFLLLGRATRLSRYVNDLDKSYTATARFGATSDTLDADGEVTDIDAAMPTEDDLRAAAGSFTGHIRQIPPMASAVKVGGERLYKLHRRGVEVERESRTVTIHTLKLVAYDAGRQTVAFEVSCTGGTYVRTLISDLAESLGTGAYLTGLRRTAVGPFNVRSAATVEKLHPDTLGNRIILPKAVVSHLPDLEVSRARRREVCNGRGIEARGFEGSFRVTCGDELLAVYAGDGHRARPEAVLCDG